MIRLQLPESLRSLNSRKDRFIEDLQNLPTAMSINSLSFTESQKVEGKRSAMHAQLSYRFHRFKRGLFARLALLHPGFVSLLSTGSPLRRFHEMGKGRTLIVFLPGIGDMAEDFIKNGIVEDMRMQGVQADAVMVDAHYGYYVKETFFERVTVDVVQWARKKGYESIWLAGVSLGGFGAALYAARHRTHIQGLVLFAPYLGTKTLIDEIRRAGGLAQWEPGTIPDKDYARYLWAWLQQRAVRNEELPIYLAYGRSDKFAPANQLLSESLPDNQVITLAGGHNWPTWKKLWRALLPSWKERVR